MSFPSPLTSDQLPQEIRDMILNFVMADDEEATGVAIHNSTNGMLFLGARYPVLRTCASLRQDGLRAFLRVNRNLLEQPLDLKDNYLPLRLRAVLKSLDKPYAHRNASYVEDVCNYGVIIGDHFFEPFEFQTMHFGDLVWDHVVPKVMETFYNVAGLLSNSLDMSEMLHLDAHRLKLRIVYTLSTKYAARCFGDVRIKDLWHDFPMVVEILLGDPIDEANKFNNASVRIKAAYDQDTAESVDKMVEKGYIADDVSYEHMGIWYNAKDDWYKETVLPGREKMFDAWLEGVRPYHEMLLRVINHMWRSPPKERTARREIFALSGLKGMNLDDDDLLGHIKGVGNILDEMESGAHPVAGVSSYAEQGK